MRRLVLLVILLGVILAEVSCGGAGKTDAPEPGSMADRMCDTNETGPGIVTLGGKKYDEECLDAYAWEAE